MQETATFSILTQRDSNGHTQNI